jgi:hypothetical protein
MRAAVVASALLLSVGCYDPAPPSGGYRCSADTFCPKGLTCECGLCVKSKSDAACSFVIDAKQGGENPTVREHQSFPVTISARAQDGSPATGYNGVVELSFTLPDGQRWCDVEPRTAEVKGGTATVMVSLNRETVPPQSPRLRARAGSAEGSSGPITVRVGPFTRDPTPVVAPLDAAGSFGWARLAVALPSILPGPSGYTMYFSGVEKSGPLDAPRFSIGVATSPDGKTFTPTSAPVIPGSANAILFAPAAYKNVTTGQTIVAFGLSASADILGGASDITLAVSPDGMTNFLPKMPPVLDNERCPDYCRQRLDFPTVVTQRDPDAAPDAGDALTSYLLFFSGQEPRRNTLGLNIPAIGLATSTDGVTFVPEPSPVLNGDIGGEQYLTSPSVYLDGSVLKMYYSFTRPADTVAGMTCDTKISIGYATSTDGRYWIRSPSNSTAPIAQAAGGWDAGIYGFLAGAVVPDPTQPNGGIVLYYSTMREVDLGGLNGKKCLPNGIGRATRM